MILLTIVQFENKQKKRENERFFWKRKYLSFFSKTEQKLNEMGYEWMMNERNGLLMNDERTKCAITELWTNKTGY